MRYSRKYGKCCCCLKWCAREVKLPPACCCCWAAVANDRLDTAGRTKHGCLCSWCRVAAAVTLEVERAKRLIERGRIIRCRNKLLLAAAAVKGRETEWERWREEESSWLFHPATGCIVVPESDPPFPLALGTPRFRSLVLFRFWHGRSRSDRDREWEFCTAVCAIACKTDVYVCKPDPQGFAREPRAVQTGRWRSWARSLLRLEDEIK